MHIRKLDLQGFKSFPDRTTFHFSDGLSGVVGPNGCGKSNVVDAVKWCLGEQSAKQLRGQAMEDIIFAGSQSRKPTGFAEVSVTFTAGDEPFPGEFARCEEVQIHRRLFRDGHSEYGINGQRVRLKDIHDLFLDTGVGNRMYSFIEQGRISKIVDARPEERRSLIEEAAGISRYKARRAETQKKLDSTTQNLERANDVVEDLSERMRALERQVKKATLYKKLKSQVRQGSILLGVAKYSGLVEDRRVLSQDLRAIKGEEETQTREVERRERDIGAAEQAVQVIDEGLLRLREELAELEASRREKESARQYQGREVVSLRQRLEVLTLQHKESAEALVSATTRRGDCNKSMEEARLALDGTDAGVTQARTVATKSIVALKEARNKVEVGKGQVMRLVTEQARIDQAAKSTQRQSEQLKPRIEALQARLAEEPAPSTELNPEMAETVAQAQSELQAARELATTAQQALATHRGSLETLRQKAKGTRGALSQQERKTTALQARVESLHRLLEDHTDVDSSLKAALEIPGVVGTLGEQLEVPEALEGWLAMALGDMATAVLVPDAACAQAVQSATSARVHLIICDGEAQPPRGALGGVTGTGPGLVALQKVLGDPGHAPDLPTALSQRPAFVDGAFVDARGLIVSGKPGAAATRLLGRRRVLHQLEDEMGTELAAQKEAEDALQEAEQALELATDGLTSFETQLEAAREAVRDKQLAERDAAHRLTAAQREYERQQKRRGELEEELLQHQTRLAGLAEEAASHLNRSQGLEEQQQQAEVQLKADQVVLFDLEGQAQTQRESLARQEAELSGLRSQAKAAQQAHTVACQQVEDLERRIQQIVSEIDATKTRITALNEDDIALNEALAQAAIQQAEVREHIDKQKGLLASERKTVDEARASLKALWETREKTTARRVQLEGKLEEVKGGIHRVRSTMEEQYHLSVAGLLDRVEQVGQVLVEADRSAWQSEAALHDGLVNREEAGEDLAITQLLLEDRAELDRWQALVKQGRGKLERMGDVNLLAVNEYEEVSDKFTILDGQRADLERSMGTIRETMAKLNRTCRERFRETFDRVDAYFQELYPRLVGPGGRARLSLTDEEDLLETGVDIFVQPPGKRMQNLSLLSGGEMAMTSIALIFSLFRVKPSPFCLLDEVDAPLDEGNGARFNLMLKEMSELSQFIVITHNKKTMECMDTLYGVTMNKPGVSSLVTVQIEGVH